MSKVRVIFEFKHISHDEKMAGNDCVEVHEKDWSGCENRT